MNTVYNQIPEGDQGPKSLSGKKTALIYRPFKRMAQFRILIIISGFNII